MILVVEDEDEMRKYVRRVLEMQGFATLGAANGLEALSLLEQQQPDLIILDLMMPFMDGLTTCREIRRTSQCPIIVLSALSDEERKVTAFDLGADDYLTKPFSPKELNARVNAVLRRTNPVAMVGNGSSALVRLGNIGIDLEGNTVTRDGELVHLTKTELKVLKLLAQNAGKIITHRMLLQQVWGPEYGEETEYLHVYIGRLRTKLEADPTHPRYLITEAGLGYRLATD